MEVCVCVLGHQAITLRARFCEQGPPSCRLLYRDVQCEKKPSRMLASFSVRARNRQLHVLADVAQFASQKIGPALPLILTSNVVVLGQRTLVLEHKDQTLDCFQCGMCALALVRSARSALSRVHLQSKSTPLLRHAEVEAFPHPNDHLPLHSWDFRGVQEIRVDVVIVLRPSRFTSAGGYGNHRKSPS